MAINKRIGKDGKPRYTVVVSHVDKQTGKQWRKAVGTYGTVKLAKSAEHAARTAIDAGTFQWNEPEPVQAIPTIADAVKLWLNTKRMNATSNTMNGYTIAADKYVIPAWGDMPVDTLTYAHVQERVNGWVADGKGAQTVNRAVLVLRGALDMQLRSGNVTANAASGIVKPAVNQQKDVSIWTDRQLQRFLASAEHHHLSPLWHLLALEGMRRGEALGLQWSDITWDGDRAVAVIHQSLVPDLANGGAAMLQNRTKTKGSRRSVLLTSETSRILRLHRDRQSFRRKELGADWQAGDAIVTTSIGTLVNPSMVRRQLENLIESCNLVDPSVMTDGKTKKADRKYLPDHEQVPQITTHDLRHIAATKMLQGGAPLQVVQARLGHADVRMTADRYGHLEVTDQRSAAEAMERAVMHMDKHG